jgi:hypothetical protein
MGRADELGAHSRWIVVQIRMLIPTRKLLTYFPSITFPIAILHAQGDAIARFALEPEFRQLVDSGLVFGVGSKRRLRKLRLTARVQHTQDIVIESTDNGRPGFRAETNKTFERQPLLTGFVFRHHPRHCEAFGKALNPQAECNAAWL